MPAVLWNSCETARTASCASRNHPPSPRQSTDSPPTLCSQNGWAAQVSTLPARSRGTVSSSSFLADPSTISIVIPAMNEADAIGAVVSRLREAASWREILVVDDGSTDDTAVRARTAGACVVRHPYNKGLSLIHISEPTRL